MAPLYKELNFLWSPCVIAQDISKPLNEQYFVLCGLVVFTILDYCGTAPV
jgi:hypothetical protein